MSKVSDCCGAAPIGNGDMSFEDVGICSECRDHCEYIEEGADEEEEYPRQKKDDTDARTSNQIDQDNARVINAGAKP